MRRIPSSRRPFLVRTPPAHASARSRRRAFRRRTRHGRRRAGTLRRRPTRSWSGSPPARASTRARSTRPPGSSSSSCASSRTARTSSSCRSDTARDAVQRDHRQACRPWRRRLGRAGRADAAAVGADRPELAAGVGHVRPRLGQLRDRPSRRLGHHARLAGITVGVIDTGYRPHVDLARPVRPGLRLHRRHPRRERRQRTRLGCAPTRATGSRAPRTRAGTSPAAASATARGTARTCRARSAPSPNNGIGVAGIN